MADAFFFFVIVILLAIVGSLLFKYRGALKRWLNDPKYGTSWQPDRKTILKRRIEDAEAEMSWLDEKAERETSTEGGDAEEVNKG